MKTDTIAAIATGMNPSGISIIRVSGDDAVSIVDKIFIGKDKKHHLKNAKTHTIHYGYILNHPYDIADQKTDDPADSIQMQSDLYEIIDEVLVSVMLSPNSYTTEDVVEINCHGGIAITNRVLDEVLKAGARMAEPGEFTKRAFLHGRIDLSQAEAVMDLIDAKSKAAAINSEKQLQGYLKDSIEKLRNGIMHETAFIEAALDDPEHFDLTEYPDTLQTIIKDVISDIDQLLQSADDGMLIKEGIRTVILGKPNVGKSTLLNLLLGQEKAIVTDIPGTTRDILEQSLSISGIPFVVLDTAGLRDTDDVVEKIGVEKAKDSAKSSDLVLYVVDSSEGFDEEDLTTIRSLLQDQKKTIILLNKSDLDQDDQVRDKIESIHQCIHNDVSGNESEIIPVISISAKENQGIEEFKNTVRKMFFSGKLDHENEFCITNTRHKDALYSAKNSLLLVLESIRNEMPEDLYMVDLMDAYSQLGTIIGKEVQDDLVKTIFSKFCMGK